MLPTSLGQRRLIGWGIGIAAGLLALGYITAPQWLALVTGLFGS
jgi:hypothetical protein